MEPFSFLALTPKRTREKPRATGLTMVIDNGLPNGQLEDVLRTCGAFIDLAKFKCGTARLYDRATLVDKLRIYRQARVKAFLGGQFHEYVFATEGEAKLGHFYEEALSLGFSTLEISDNLVPLSAQQRRRQIERAVSAGLEVIGEVGSKESQSNPALLIEQAELCLESGAAIVLIEAAELVEDGEVKREVLDLIKRRLPLSKVMIELAGPWIPGVRLCDVEEMKKKVLKEFGPDANLANVEMHDAFDLEAQRVGLGPAGPLSQ